MTKQITISVVSGKKGNLRHNRRKEGFIRNELPVKSRYNRPNITIKHNSVHKILKEKLTEPIKNYNFNQKVKSRELSIPKYRKKIENSNKQEMTQELIIGIADKEYWQQFEGNTYLMRSQTDLVVDVINETLAKWKELYPELPIVESTIHFDEDGSPHCHITYMTFHEQNKIGLSTQIGNTGAWKQIENRLQKELGSDYKFNLFNEIRNDVITRWNERNDVSKALVKNAGVKTQGFSPFVFKIWQKFNDGLVRDEITREQFSEAYNSLIKEKENDSSVKINKSTLWTKVRNVRLFGDADYKEVEQIVPQIEEKVVPEPETTNSTAAYFARINKVNEIELDNDYEDDFEEPVVQNQSSGRSM